MLVPYKNIPTLDAQTWTWSETTFESQDKFAEFLKSIFKEPGEYGFDETTMAWNVHGRRFQEKKYYTQLPKGTKDWRDFWNFEKKKCRLGVIWRSGDKIWYLPREYYMLLNFLPITNKEKGSIQTFADVRDTNYHMHLYERIAECVHLDSGLVKKRQMLSSYSHCAKLINYYWFERLKRLKMLASDDTYISGKQGSWLILNSYRDFLNEHTPWHRPSNPGEVGNWEQKVAVKRGGRWLHKGRKSTIAAITTKRDPEKGVGGPTYIAFFEEAGIAPTMHTTKAFLDPALESGPFLRVGTFIAAGSVGDLDDCEPLRRFVMFPDDYHIYAVPCRNFDSTGVVKMCGLFIPAQYGMPPYIDQYGNSMVKEATVALANLQEEWKKLPPEEYRLKMSQNPMTLEQAFAYRKDSYFPGTLIERRQQVIEEQRREGLIKPLRGIMDEDEHGNPVFVPFDKIPDAERPTEMGFPVDPKQKDKRGLTLIYGKIPEKTPDLGINFAGIDTIEANITSTSESLFCIVIRSRRIEVHREDAQGNQTVHYEGGKLLAIWAGRYDDINDTNRQGELLQRLFNAIGAVERNKPNYINHMRRKGFSRLLAKRKDMTLFKEIDMTGFDNDEYGIYLGSDGKANDIVNQNILEDITTDLDVIHKKNKDGSLGEVVKTIKGVDLVDDHWTLEELKQYFEGKNTDRRIAFGLATTLTRCMELSFKKKVVQSDKPKPAAPRKAGFSLLGGRAPAKRQSLL